MFEIIEKIRRKPESSKNKIAFLTSFTVSGFIFVIWLTVIYPDLSFVEKQKQVASAGEAGVFSSFVENVKQGFVGIKQEAGMIKNIINNVVVNVATSTHYSAETGTSSAAFPTGNFQNIATTTDETSTGF